MNLFQSKSREKTPINGLLSGSDKGPMLFKNKNKVGDMKKQSETRKEN